MPTFAKSAESYTPMLRFRALIRELFNFHCKHGTCKYHKLAVILEDADIGNLCVGVKILKFS